MAHVQVERQISSSRVQLGLRSATEGQAQMAVVSLPTDAGSQSRDILDHLLEHGDVAGRDAAGRTVITLAVDDWLLERLLTFDARAEDHQCNGDGEPDDDAEEDGAPTSL